MTVEYFFDTNVILYAFDLRTPRRRAIAMQLIEDAWTQPDSVATSVQVLQEFFVNFVRAGNPASEAAQITTDISAWRVCDNTLSVFKLGVEIRDRFQLSIWDAMIIAAAQSSGAKILLTEDLNHGQDYGGVVAINPFIDPIRT